MPYARNRNSGVACAERKHASLGLLVVTLLAAPGAQGGEFATSIGYLGEYTDNIYRDATKVEEFANSAIVSMGYQETSGDLLARVRAQAQYRQYNQQTYDNEGIYFLDAAAIWSIVPQNLTWTVLDRYDQLTAFANQADTPDNRVNINALSTGPDVYIHFGRQHALMLGARYGNVRYGDTPASFNNDNDRYTGLVSWTYQATPEIAFSLNYDNQQVHYIDDATASLNNYSRQDGFLRAAWLYNLTQVTADAGATRLDRNQGPDDHGPTLRLTWNQQLNTQTFLTLLLGKEFLDPGSALLSTVTDPAQSGTMPLPTPSVPSDGLAQIYYTNRAELTYRYSGTLFGVGVNGFYRDFDYQPTVPPTPPEQSGNRDANGYRLDLSYNPSGTFVPSVFVYKSYTSYHEVERNDETGEAGIQLLYRSTRELSTTLEFRTRWQSSVVSGADRLLVPEQDYVEHRVVLGLIYASNPELAVVNPRQR